MSSNSVDIPLASRVLSAGALVCLALPLATGCSWKETQVAIASEASASPTIDHEVETIHGERVSLASFRGKTLLIVNTASECGLTPQYAGLQDLYTRYKDKGLVVLGFPCNDFGGQEPGSSEQIESFCSAKFNVSFPLFGKVKAKGDKSPLYKTLTEELPEPLSGEIKWNFTKFLVSPEGKVVARFEPMVEPLAPEVIKLVEQHLPPPSM